MPSARQMFLGTLAVLSAAAALWLLVSAARTGALNGQVFFTTLPLVMLFGIAWRGLTGKPD